MEFFKRTTAASNNTIDWPAWLQRAWEREFGEKSAFEPDGNGGYIARSSNGEETAFAVGDLIQPKAFA